MKPSAACSSEALQRIRHADGPKDGGCAFIIDREVPFEAAKHRLEIDEADDRGVIVDQIDPSAGLVDQELKRTTEAGGDAEQLAAIEIHDVEVARIEARHETEEELLTVDFKAFNGHPRRSGAKVDDAGWDEPWTCT